MGCRIPLPTGLLQVLNSLADAGIIPIDRADISKKRFTALHGALVRSMAREKDMLEEAKGLKRKMEVSGEENTPNPNYLLEAVFATTTLNLLLSSWQRFPYHS